MTKWNYRCDEVNLNHDQMIELNKDGLLKLIIPNSHEKQIVSLAKEEFKKVMNTEKIIDLAMKDAEFFEKVKEMEGWIFQIEEGKEKEYLVHETEKDDHDENEKSNEDEEENLDRDDENDNNDKIQDRQLFAEWIDKRVNDYGTYMVENPKSIDIVDTSELPHPKGEILDAIIISVILDQDGGSIGELRAAAMELAYYQENVGPKRLGALGVDSSEFLIPSV